MRRSVLYSIVATVVLLPVLGGFVVKALLDAGRPELPLAGGPRPGPYRGSEPPPGLQIPQLELRDQLGRRVKSDDFGGKVTLVTFLDTDCVTKCPVIAAEIGDALRMLSRRERRDVVPLAITVNPRGDTSRSVRAFLRRRRAAGIVFLLGTVKELRPVWKAFHIVSAADTGNADIHSADVRIFDRAGVWVSTQHEGVDLKPVNLAHDIRFALQNRRT